MSSPNISELTEVLGDLVDWELVAIHLRNLDKAETEKIKRDESKTEQQKRLLYERWLLQCPNATWNDIVTALKKGKQFALAVQVMEKILNKADAAAPPQNKQIILFSEKVEEEDEVIEKLEELHESFTKLFQEVNDEIETMVVKDKAMLHQIAARISNAKIVGLKNLRECQTVDEIVKKFEANCSFLDGSVLNSIVKYGLSDNTSLQTRTKEHMEKVKVFKQKTLIKTLKKTLNEKIDENPAQTTLIVKLNNDWDKVTFNHVEELILVLSGTHAEAVRVKNGSVEITFMISRDKVMCFNITIQKRQLMCLIGVFYLQIGDERLFIEDENMNYTFENGLLEAGKVGHTQATEFILNMNIVNINYQDNEGRTALMLASEHGHIEALKLILSAGANVNIQDNIGQTAVMVAKTVEIYQTLAQAADADTSIVTHNGSTSLMISCFLGNHEVANYLLFTLNHEITSRPDRMTLLMCASHGGDQHIVKHLLRNGADPNIQNNYGETAIWISCCGGHYIVTKMLLKHKADPDIANNDDRTPLMAASEKEHFDIVLLLLKQGVNPNGVNKNGVTALMHASHKGNFDIVGLLLIKKADPNIQDNDGWTSLMIASQRGHHKIVELLLNYTNADPHITDYEYEKTALVLASENGHIETVAILLKFTDRYTYFEEYDWYNDTDHRDYFQKAIQLSCLNGHYTVTQALLNYATQCKSKDISKNTLRNASQNGHYKIVQLLLNFFGPKQDDEPYDVDYYDEAIPHPVDYMDHWPPWVEEDDGGRTALMAASENGHNEIVNLLLANGANPNMINDMYETAIFLSSLNGHYEVTQTLLEYQSNLSITDYDGWTALTAASYNGHQKIVELLLLKEKFDPNFREYKKGPTALMMASEKGHLNIVDLLLSNGADPNIQDMDSVTAIWLSCYSGHYKVMETLLKHKADPNVCASDKLERITPMMIASLNGHHEVVQMLLVQERIDPNITGIHGQTALMYASQNGHITIIELLVSNGANPNIQNNYGVTAIWLSCLNGHYTATKILLKHNALYNICTSEKCRSTTPLMAASEKGHGKIVELLLQQGGVDPNDAIIVACMRNQYRIVTILLKAGANPLHVDNKGKDPLTVIINNTLSYKMLKLLQNHLNDIETQKFCLKGVFISLSLRNHSLVNYFMNQVSSLPDTIDTVVQHYDRQDMVLLKRLSQQENIGGQWLEQNTTSKQLLKEQEVDKMFAMTLDLIEKVPLINIQDIDKPFNNYSEYYTARYPPKQQKMLKKIDMTSAHNLGMGIKKI